jgi:hypothetical protein
MRLSLLLENAAKEPRNPMTAVIDVLKGICRATIERVRVNFSKLASRCMILISFSKYKINQWIYSPANFQLKLPS